jgi:hypothetical protein
MAIPSCHSGDSGVNRGTAGELLQVNAPNSQAARTLPDFGRRFPLVLSIYRRRPKFVN